MRQKEQIEGLLNSLQNPLSNVKPSKDLIEWRILNENEEIDNLYVQNKTLFINDENMILKDVDGKTEKWEVKKIYPIDKKDQKINELEEKIKELEGRLNESTESNVTTKKRNKSFANDVGDTKSEPKTSGE
jgi:TolA-binding protein